MPADPFSGQAIRDQRRTAPTNRAPAGPSATAGSRRAESLNDLSGGPGDAVIRHERHEGRCSRCDAAVGPGIVGARGEERFCETCMFVVEGRLGMLLVLGMHCRILAWGSRHLPSDLTENGRTLLAEMLLRIYAVHEERYPPGPVRWMSPEIASAIDVSNEQLAGRPLPERPDRAAGRRVLRRATQPADDLEPDVFDEVAERLGIVGSGSPRDAADWELGARRRKRPLQSATSLLAERADIEPPDALALAALVEIVDVGGVRPDWQERDAARALAWLIRRNEEAAGQVEPLLAAAGQETHPGCLLREAKRRYLEAERPNGRTGRRRRRRPGEGATGARGEPSS